MMYVAAVAGGRSLAVVSTRSGEMGPWLIDLEGRAPPRAIAVSGPGPQEIAFSSDGRRYLACRQGAGLELGSLDGAPLRRLTDGTEDTAPQFDRGDTRALFTRRGPDGRPQVMAVALEGGTPLPVLEVGSDRAMPSPVNDEIVYLAGPTLSEELPTIVNLRTGARRQLSAALPVGTYWTGLRFSVDGRRVAVIRDRSELIEVDAGTGTVIRTAKGAPMDRLFLPTYTRDGLLMLRLAWRGNLWMADVMQQP
jgi:hypothetical protein